ncbi:MAG: aromatic amino acid aminotransferase [Sphingopyxis macrogoltabida]|uniref:Aromatic amino acid aminotransferase n=1 Tax=Sphingopyxis macrogoltabida TaxID=33050 RepID=A0A2W5NE87_SPHMC|nr:MAG: aromatic amino acid aminotransferase [Sphingopyxis macrogoltabida]
MPADLLDARPATAAPFAGLTAQPADALLGLIALFRADTRPAKIDLGVGVFRDDAGHTPVMRAVKAAETTLLETQDSKSYLGAEGDAAYTDLLADVVLGADAARDRIGGVQTPGGTGALRLGAELLARANRDARVWIGAPTWPNHAPIFAEAGLATRSHRFYDTATATIDFAAMIADLDEARAGDVLLLHGCCHNPTGASFDAAQWRRIADLCAGRGLIPFIDLAYQGLGDGLDADAAATRMIFAALPTVLLAYSCDKNFGLYRDRVGALWVQSPDRATAATVRSNLLALARSLWSMPPDHGAAIVRTILSDASLRAEWAAELAAMRARINDLRAALAAAHPRLAPIADQRGMFAMLPLTPDTVAALREERAIYMAGNGRINIAGLRAETVPILARALQPHLDGRKDPQ